MIGQIIFYIFIWIALLIIFLIVFISLIAKYFYDVKNNKIDFYNTNEIYKEDPQTSVDFDFDGVDKVNVRALISDGVVSFYVNGKCALTARMYQSQGTEWGIFGIKSDFTCEDVNIYK
jgi:beta-fructofuranosidase